MCKFLSKSEGVPFQISFYLGDLTRNDPSAITNCLHGCIKQCIPVLKGECNVFKKKIFIMDENDTLSEYNKITLGHNCTNGAVYSKIYFKVDICSAH